MVSALDSGASGPGSSPGRGHCLVFLGKTLYSHSASLSDPGMYKWVPANLMLGGNPAMDQHPIQGEVEILPVASCYRNQDMLRPDEPLGPNADFTFTSVDCVYDKMAILWFPAAPVLNSRVGYRSQHKTN